MKSYHDKDIIKAACDHYGLNPKVAKLIRWNSNLIYDCGNRILRLTHSANRKREDIEVELDWLSYLAVNKLKVVKIIASKQKNLLEQIPTKDEEHHFIVVCFEKIKGEKISRDKWGNEHFQKLGNLTGSLHRIGQQYQEQPTLLYKNWNEIVEHDFYKYLPKDSNALEILYHQLVKEMRGVPIRKNNYGMIHYDIHMGNYLLSKKGEIVLFDFEMCCKSWYINDVAAILYYALHFSATRGAEGFESQFLKNFCQGYEKEYHLETSEKSYFPVFLLYRDLMVYGYLFKIWANQELTSNQAKYKTMIAQSITERRSALGL